MLKVQNYKTEMAILIKVSGKSSLTQMYSTELKFFLLDFLSADLFKESLMRLVIFDSYL